MAHAIRHLMIFCAGTVLLGVLVACNPIGPVDVPVYSPDQVFRHGEQELVFSAVVDHSFQEGQELQHV